MSVLVLHTPLPVATMIGCTMTEVGRNEKSRTANSATDRYCSRCHTFANLGAFLADQRRIGFRIGGPS
jgi:hypothetical protein